MGTTHPEVDATTRVVTDTSIWWRWWALAAIAHMLGTPGTEWGARGVVNLIVGLVAVGLVARPERRDLRTALAVGVVVSVIVEAPFLGNHWLLAGLVSLVALTGRPWSAAPDRDGHPSFAAGARAVLLVFYGFAAFAKLNDGFLDPVASCARFFTNQTLTFFQLPELGGDAAVAGVLPYLAVGIELSVPVLLLIPRTRRIGVFLALAFHLVLTLDLRQHFYDFTLVLLPLFTLFARPDLLRRLDEALPRPRLVGPWMAIVGIQIAAFQLPLPLVVRGVAILAAWATWIPLLLLIVRALVRSAPTIRPATDPGLARLSPLAAVVVAIAIVNGLTPYLGIKTSTSFNMYANLLTVDGESNHLLVPSTGTLRDVDLVRIVATDDEDLAEYIEAGFDPPVANLAAYLADHPEVSVTITDLDGSNRRTVTADDLADEQPSWWEERFLLVRSIPTDPPPACQNTFLVAR